MGQGIFTKGLLLISATLTLLLISAPSSSFASTLYNNSSEVLGDGDALPWPWGSECPFPWDEIEGMWKATSPDQMGRQFAPSLGYYQFEVVSVWVSGTRVVEVTKYSPEGEIIGKGRGYAPEGQRILRAVILTSEGLNLPNHRVIVRSYNESATASCSSSLVTVLTARPMSDDRTQETHFILTKVPKNSK